MLGMFVSFVVIGALQALYGPAVPGMQDRFGISAGEVGLVLAMHFVGALLGVLGTSRMRRWGNRAFLIIALTATAVGCLGFAMAPVWPAALAAAFVVGLGFGWIDVGVNELFIEYYGSNGTGMLNLLHGVFGAGAVLGPLFIGALPRQMYVWSFVVCAALCLIALLTVRGVSGRPVRHTRQDVRWAAVGRMTALFMIFFVLHVGVESGVGGWETSHLVSLGWAAGPAAMATSAFWLALTGIRFAISPIARFFTAQQIVLASLVLVMVGTVLAHWNPAAPVGYILTGIGVGPLFPTGLIWLTEKLPGVPGVTSYVIAMSMLGGVLPSLVGGAVEQWGPGVIPTTIAAMGAVCVLVALVIRSLASPLRAPHDAPANRVSGAAKGAT
ncbi:MFS transporter [Sinosporangium album]|nr:MFS transporter [Sinosporangium album]